MESNKQLSAAIENNAESERRYAFLAQTAIELLDIDSVKDIYAYAAQKINQLLGGKSIVAVVEYNQMKKRWTMQHIEGVGKRMGELSRILGFDIRHLEGDISTRYYKEILSGKLTEVAFDFPGLFNNRVSDAIGKAVKKCFQSKRCFVLLSGKTARSLRTLRLLQTRIQGLSMPDLLRHL